MSWLNLRWSYDCYERLSTEIIFLMHSPYPKIEMTNMCRIQHITFTYKTFFQTHGNIFEYIISYSMLCQSHPDRNLAYVRSVTQRFPSSMFLSVCLKQVLSRTFQSYYSKICLADTNKSYRWLSTSFHKIYVYQENITPRLNQTMILISCGNNKGKTRFR